MGTVFTQSPCGSQSQSQSGSQFTSHDRNHNRGLKVVRAVTISVIKVSHHSQPQSFFSSDSDCGSSKGSCTQWSQSRIIVLVTILVAVIVLISVADCARPVFFEPCFSYKWLNFSKNAWNFASFEIWSGCRCDMKIIFGVFDNLDAKLLSNKIFCHHLLFES